jgi:carbon-monoxide dehydrogenase iron sulfur subunit
LGACLVGAIYRVPEIDTVLIDPDKCINCASCAMACPFGVIRFHESREATPGKVVAVKCDNCVERLSRDEIPACVGTCMTGALTFEDPEVAMRRKTADTAKSVWIAVGEERIGGCPGFDLLRAAKRAQLDTAGRRP